MHHHDSEDESVSQQEASTLALMGQRNNKVMQEPILQQQADPKATSLAFNPVTTQSPQTYAVQDRVPTDASASVLDLELYKSRPPQVINGDKTETPQQERRKQMRKECSAAKFETEDSKKYLKKMTFDVPLDSLYTLVDTCHSNRFSEFAAVVFKVESQEFIERFCTVNDQKYEYLLQVWTKFGNLYFERKLRSKPSYWSISGKVLLFKEEDDSNILHALKLCTKSSTVLHKFTLPLDDMLAQLEATDEKLMKKDFVYGFEPGNHLLVSLGHKIYFCPITEIHGRHKDVLQEATMFLPAINEHKVQRNEKASEYYQFTTFGLKQFDCIDIDPDYRQLGFQELGAKQTQKKQSSVLMLILEHKQKHILQFTRIGIRFENGKNIVSFKLMGTRAQNNVEEQQDEKVNATSKPPEIRAWKSFITCNENDDPFHLAVVLREDGQTDFYYDFNLVEMNKIPKPVEEKNEEDSIFASMVKLNLVAADEKDTEDEKLHEITDIAYDFDHIYLRTKPDKKNGANFIRIRTSWCQRIGLTASSGIDRKERIKANLIDRKWKRINSRLVQSYVKLHTSFVSFEKYFLLAHRTFVSIYDVSSKVWKHFNYHDAVRYLGIVERAVKQDTGNNANDRLKSLDQYSERYEVLVVVGANQIQYLNTENLKDQGPPHDLVEKQPPSDQEDRTKTLKNLIISHVYKDQIFFSGVFLLVRKEKGSKQILISPDDDKLNTFVKWRVFGAQVKDAHYQLLYYSQNAEYKLLDQPPKASTDGKQSPSKTAHQVEIKPQNEAEDQSDILSDKCTFVNYIDFDKVTKKKKHMIMIYNPQLGKFRAFALNIAKDSKDAKEEKSRTFVNVIQKQMTQLNQKPARVILKITIEQTDFSFDFTKTGIKERDKALIGVYKNVAQREKMVIATELHFFVFDGNELKFMYESKNNALRQADNYYIYAIQNNQRNTTVKEMMTGKEKVDRHFRSSGLYLIQLSQLMNGVYESYKLQSAIAGKNRELSFSNYSQRMVYLHDYSRASIVPYVHRNTVNLMGVSQKDQYQIWREKCGFFSALNNEGEIQTWSLATGQQLYKYRLNEQLMSLHDYEVFKANPQDNSYQGDQYNFDEMSRSLLISKKPISGQAEEEDECKDLTKHTNVTAGFEIELNEPPVNTYSFVLLEMIGHLDQEFDTHHNKGNAVDDGEQQLQDHDEQIRVALKFEFKILENEKEEKSKEQYWDIILQPTQHIYISKNKQKLLEIVNHKQAYIYTSEPVGNASDNEVRWVKQTTIKRFPTLLQGDASVNSLFSHDFTYYFDFDFNRNQLVIMETMTQVPFYRIETDMVNFNVPFTKIKEEQRIAEVGRNICFYKCSDENVIQIITKDELNCLFEIKTKKDTEDTIDITPEDREMVLISYVKIDNYDLLDDNPHNILECISPFEGKTITRLIRKAQNYKMQTLHQQNYKNYKSNVATKLRSIDFYNKIYTMDYFYQSKNNPVFVSELSFSILNWRMAERIIQEEGFDVSNIETAGQLELLFCIFPKSQTIIHKLCDNKSPENSEDMVKILKRLFQTANEGINDSSSTLANQSLTIPFIKDKDGNTPIDLALESRNQEADQTREQDSNEDKANENDEEESDKGETEENYTDLEIVSVYLNYLKDAPFLNQGELIVDSLINCIEHEVSGVAEYLEKRFIKTQSIPGKIQNQLKPEITDKFNDHEYGIISSDPVASIRTMQEKMYLPDKDNKWNQQYDNYFFDIPIIYQKGTKGKQFISALEQASHENMKLFSIKSIQMIINYQWKEWETVIYAFKIVPYFFLLLVFCFWSNRILTKSHNADILELRNYTISLIPTDFNHTYNLDLAIEELTRANLTSVELLDAYNEYSAHIRYRTADIALASLLIFWASWFMITEIDALIQDWRAYITVNYIENLFDMTPLILLYINTIWSICDPGHIVTGFWVMQSLLSILLWTKFVWFLRSRDFFAYLVRSLVEAVKDIRAFFFILMVACLGYADAFLSLSRSMGDDAFLKGYYQAFKYAWLFCIGSADSIENANYYADILVFLASITLIIIMLNVLIAIAGQSLESASSLKVEYAFRAKVELLNELMRHPFIRLYEACSKKTDESVETANDLLFVSFVLIPPEEKENKDGQETVQD